MISWLSRHGLMWANVSIHVDHSHRKTQAVYLRACRSPDNMLLVVLECNGTQNFNRRWSHHRRAPKPPAQEMQGLEMHVPRARPRKVHTPQARPRQTPQTRKQAQPDPLLRWTSFPGPRCGFGKHLLWHGRYLKPSNSWLNPRALKCLEGPSEVVGKPKGVLELGDAECPKRRNLSANQTVFPAEQMP